MRLMILLTMLGLGVATMAGAAVPGPAIPGIAPPDAASRQAALALSSPPATQPVPAMLMAALDAYRAGRFAEARVRFRTLADADSAIAETMLGTIYARGQGVRADPATASAYYFRAAQRGYAPAQLAFARMLAAGQGVRADPALAWIWARRAQQRGDPRVTAAAAAMVAELDAGRAVGDRAALEVRVAEWRPWPNGRE